MPTPRERANAVVSAWLDPSTWNSPFVIPTSQLDRLAQMIAAAIDAQVADWMASQPPPATNGWHKVAADSHVVAAEPGKTYTASPLQPAGGGPGIEVVTEPSVVAQIACRHFFTRWNEHNTRLVCMACGDEFKPGTCIRCGGPAVSEQGFSCGRGTGCAS